MGSLISSVFRQSQLWGQSRLARLLPSLALKSSKAGDCTAPLGSLFLDLFPWRKNVALYLAWTPHLEYMGDALLRLPGGFSLDDGERLLLDAPKSSLLWAEQAQLLHQVNPCCTSWMHHSSDWGIIVLFFFFWPSLLRVYMFPLYGKAQKLAWNDTRAWIRSKNSCLETSGRFTTAAFFLKTMFCVSPLRTQQTKQ